MEQPYKNANYFSQMYPDIDLSLELPILIAAHLPICFFCRCRVNIYREPEILIVFLLSGPTAFN